MGASTPQELECFDDVLVSHTNIRTDSSTTFEYYMYDFL